MMANGLQTASFLWNILYFAGDTLESSSQDFPTPDAPVGCPNPASSGWTQRHIAHWLSSLCHFPVTSWRGSNSGPWWSQCS